MRVVRIGNPASQSQDVKGKSHVFLAMTQDSCLISGHSRSLPGLGPGQSTGATTNASGIVLTVQAQRTLRERLGRAGEPTEGAPCSDFRVSNDFQEGTVPRLGPEALATVRQV